MIIHQSIVDDDIGINNENKNEKQDIAGLEDRVFPLSFSVIKIAGFWMPTSFGQYLGIFYGFYTLFCFLSVIILMITIIVDNAITEKSIRAFIENLYLILTILNGMSKLSNVILRRQKVLHLLQNNMEDRWSILRDEEEVKIIKESMSSERLICQFCIYLVTANNVSNALNPLLHPDPDHDLMVDAYSPCDRAYPACFWSSYIFQVFGYVITSLVHVGCDCMVFNFVDRTCAHLRILEHRLLKLPELAENDEMEYLKACIKDHYSICEAIKETSDTFYETVFVQFVSSISVLCTNIYLLSIQELFSAEFIAVFAYLCCAFVQNFFYCWYGNKVSVNSMQLSISVFNMNWCVLRQETKKMLMYFLFKTSQKVYLFNSAIVTLTPESFVNILKVSYSAFNILTQTSKK